jgi:DNA adenine methylase
MMPRGRRLVEPFAGSAAVTLAAAARKLFDEYLLGDALAALAGIWEKVLEQPEELAGGYGKVWRDQLADPRRAYDDARERFNATGDAVLFLYLLARCVKGSVRFNSEGQFNQSPDNRRLGMRPQAMRRQIMGAHHLLRSRTEVRAADFRETLAAADDDDVVYMDPPYQGISTGRDSRYVRGLAVEELIPALDELNSRSVPFLLSYDGSCGEKTYGRSLPAELGLQRVLLVAGRSAQATLSGRAETTVESLYISPAATAALNIDSASAAKVEQLQLYG